MSLSFTVSQGAGKFGARVGEIVFTRDASTTIRLNTPGIMITTSRGVIPHLSRDHYPGGWIHIPFETFLEQKPPVPTLPGFGGLHRFLGFPASTTLLSLSLRPSSSSTSPSLPPNGNNHVSAWCVRGVRKVSTEDWQSYVSSSKPDVVFALTDELPAGVLSQKRLTKSIERGLAWARSAAGPTTFVQMAGGSVEAARQAFGAGLTELDVAGYVFDLGTTTSASLLHASLIPLPLGKPRLATAARSPHEILSLIRDVGIDLFDAGWAQDAANIGVALNFHLACTHNEAASIGYNLYDTEYAAEFTPLSLSCDCQACKPQTKTLVPASQHNVASTGEEPGCFTKAYIHHLLHTHEMSAHALLVLHNLRVTETFFADIREIAGCPETYSQAVKRFTALYNDPSELFDGARQMWKDVVLARGKGRLAREKTGGQDS